MISLRSQKGSSTIFTMIILFLITTIALTYIKKKLNIVHQIKNKQRLFLCTKEFNGETSLYIKNIKDSNSIIKILSLGKVASLFIPGYGMIANKSFQKAKKMAQAMQELKRLSYMKKIRKLNQRNCNINKLAYITPTQITKKLTLKRSRLTGEALLRKKIIPIIIQSNEEFFLIKRKNIGRKKSALQSYLVPKFSKMKKAFH